MSEMVEQIKRAMAQIEAGDYELIEDLDAALQDAPTSATTEKETADG